MIMAGFQNADVMEDSNTICGSLPHSPVSDNFIVAFVVTFFKCVSFTCTELVKATLKKIRM
jgi:hypothetical protein